MKSLEQISDPVYIKKGQSAIDNFFLKYIKDERDLPFIYLSIEISLILFPLAILLFFPLTLWFWIPLAIVYTFLNNLVFKGPFGLMLHCTSHRRFFKKKYDFMNQYLPWVLAPIFGQTPETYFTHHIGMYHPENNLEEDESSTMHYQRDSFRSFMLYFLDFMIFGIFKVTNYFKRKNRKKLRLMMIRGEILYFTLTIILYFVNFKATLIVFILPFLISRFIMMLGNWTQHAFVDAADPGNPYKNSITTINVKYNHKCWNDGYHISHHIFPTMHWTEHPAHLINNKADYAANKAFVFEGLDFGKVFFLLMRKKYDVLANHIINFNNNTFESREELITLMKARSQRIPKEDFSAEVSV